VRPIACPCPDDGKDEREGDEERDIGLQVAVYVPQRRISACTNQAAPSASGRGGFTFGGSEPCLPLGRLAARRWRHAGRYFRRHRRRGLGRRSNLSSRPFGCGAGGRLARRIGRHAWSGLAVAGRHRVASTRLWRQSNPPDDAWGSLSMAYPRARNPTNTTTTGRRKSIAIRWLGAVQGSTGATAIVTSLPSRVPFQHRFATFATLTLGHSLIDTRFSATEEGSCGWSRPRCRRRRVVNGSDVIERGRRRVDAERRDTAPGSV